MRYFRYRDAQSCNVYMNYSFWQPNFSLMARNAHALTETERSFIREFNAGVLAMVRRGGAGDCQPPPGGARNPAARDLYRRCMATLDRFGIVEQGWVGGRLPAPSNCISPKTASAGTVFMIRGSLPTSQMTVGEWIRRSETGSESPTTTSE
jgi:hypothetical protein